jgi:energy-coupling factor transporter ATP-binding protein EcfA2
MELAVFDPTRIKPDSVVVMIGYRSSGKSTAMEHISCVMKDKLSYVQVISGTAVAASNQWRKHVPQLFITSEWNPGQIEAIRAQQQLDMLQNQLDHPEWDDDTAKNAVPYIGVLMEDITDDTVLRRCPILKKIYQTGRHDNMFLMIGVWYAKMLAPDMRLNINWVFIFWTANKDELEKLHESYASNMAFNDFCFLIDHYCQKDEVTGARPCLVVDMFASGNKLQDRIYVWCAKPNLDFRVGTPELWEFANAATISLQRRLNMARANVDKRMVAFQPANGGASGADEGRRMGGRMGGRRGSSVAASRSLARMRPQASNGRVSLPPNRLRYANDGALRFEEADDDDDE